MKVISITASALPSRLLTIGYVGENERTQVRIDCTAILTEYPHAAPSLAIKPPVGAVYPVVVSREGNDVVWDVSNADLQNEGDGELQLTFIKDGVVAKTVIGKLRISRSLLVTGEQPDVIQTWYDAATEKLAEVDAQIVELEGMVDTATDAATRAEQSEDNAITAAANAATSAATASTKAAEAQASANTATAKAAEAALSATQAINSAVSAADSERGAIAKAAEAAQSAQTATAKATQATEAAQTATGKAEEASASATAAQTSATDAAASATAAQASQTAAKASETAASASASQAAQSAQTASTAAQTATQKATEATQSATNAATFAGTATTKAEEAAESAQAASDAQTAVEQTAEQLADSLEQIDQNTQDIAELEERKANVDGYYPDMTVGNAEQLNSSKYVKSSEPYTLRTSGGTSDIGNREYVDAVVGGTLAWNQMVRDEASENSTDFADVVTVTDAVEDAAGVKVKIEPVQDLHGFDNPWPAGGGKNLLNMLKSSYSGTVTDGYYVDLSSGYQDFNQITLVAGQTYTLSYDLQSSVYPCNISAGCGNGSYSQDIKTNQAVADGRVSVTFTPTEEQLSGRPYFAMRPARYGRTTTFTWSASNIQLELNSAATDFAPYSNICPITGWTAAQVTRTGKNLWGGLDFAQVFIDNQPNAVLDTNSKTIMHPYLAGDKNQFVCFDAFKPNTVYTVILTASSEYGKANLIVNYTDGSYQYFPNFSSTDKSLSVLTTQTGKSVKRIKSTNQQGSTTFFYDECGVFEGALTTDDFETYQGNTYDITLPTEAGTVYGGELTVNADGSGSLVVDRVKRVFDGSSDENIGPYNSGYDGFYIRVDDANINGTPAEQLKANYLVGVPRRGDATGYKFALKTYSSPSDNKWFFVSNTGITDYYEFKAYLANNNLEVLYPLENPITYTFTASQIRTILGQNNIWADTGDLALTYTGTNEHLTLESGKKYLTRINGTDSMLLGSGQEITAVKGTDNVFDLTQMFGTAVADYVYGQGAAFFRKWFPSTRYPYNAGELRHVEGLQNHDMVGFNQFNADVAFAEVASITKQGNSFVGNASAFNLVTYQEGWEKIRYIEGATYYARADIVGNANTTWNRFEIGYTDGTKTVGNQLKTGTIWAISDPAKKISRINLTFGSNGNYPITVSNFCINLSHNGSRNGEYEPYEKHSYPLDSSVVLRGIPKVSANGVYWDGDRYLPDGTVERRYGVVEITSPMVSSVQNYSNVVYAKISKPTDSADKSKATSKCVHGMFATNAAISNWDDASKVQQLFGGADYLNYWFGFPIGTTLEQAKSVLVGTELVYELATPTTETAQPYHSTQWVSDWGTEEFVSTGIVPVGTETRYPANLRDKLQHLPDAANGNGSYLITQTDGQMTLTPFPAPPSSAGNYVLKATVTNGVATYTWEVAT